MANGDILWIKSRMPGAVNDGSSLVTKGLLSCFDGERAVDLLCCRLTGREDALAASPAPPLRRVFVADPDNRGSPLRRVLYRARYETLGLLTSTPRPVYYETGNRLRETLTRILSANSYTHIVAEYYTVAPLVSDSAAMTSLVLHDADHVTMAVQAQSDRSWIRAASLRYQSRQLERYLQRTCAPFNHILTLTDYDREAYRTLGIDNVHALAVPLPDLPAAAPALDGDTLVFLGSVDYLPNRHALSWFLREVFPLVTRSFPRARLRVIGGGNPAGEPSIPLCSQVDWIGRNTAEEFERQFVDVAIGIAPVWLGTGVKVKVLDMVWRGLPVVSTTVASRGTPVERGAGLIADSAESFAAAVCELLGSREHRLALQAAGRDLLRQYHVGPSSRARVRAAILGGDLNS